MRGRKEVFAAGKCLNIQNLREKDIKVGECGHS